MKTRLLRGAATAALLGIVPVAAAAGPAETIRLAPQAASGVSGKLTLSSPGDRAAAKVSVRVRGLKPGAQAVLVVNGGNCKRRGASVARVLTARADVNGIVTASGRVRYRGVEPVPFSTLADGAHAFSILAGARVVACGVVPGID